MENIGKPNLTKTHTGNNESKNTLIPVPVNVIDILNIACETVGISNQKTCTLLIPYFINILSKDEIPRQTAFVKLENGLLKGKAQRILLLTIHEDISHQIAMLKVKACLQTTSDVIKLVILRIYDDLLLHPKDFIIRDLRRLS
ncbi:hypothetical protein KIH87_01305 [Paraneptunicella aestuarii]|uniref:hypothetical protein n=1 Tax=Paraneptunicella aestuarii TaxID=2831148 RepID=UPI001E35A92C|nr:hypothetical protein [Paraneptunicella aestuarii]UAA39034.1 hypothetical protein KIH87_01305 [Paraneptunicella aestuarii]